MDSVTMAQLDAELTIRGEQASDYDLLGVLFLRTEHGVITYIIGSKECHPDLVPDGTKDDYGFGFDILVESRS